MKEGLRVFVTAGRAENIEMFTLKVIFVILLCAPLLYLAAVLLEKLCDGVLIRYKRPSVGVNSKLRTTGAGRARVR
jgi:hypothetical protein